MVTGGESAGGFPFSFADGRIVAEFSKKRHDLTLGNGTLFGLRSERRQHFHRSRHMYQHRSSV
uniref:Uncharacterized protein n=1 Tax=Arabidopsis thaliana TaxID=3702 RepID=Q0WQM2_ARATH|nr:hypothetical protein [Arabidopsis thaliana]